MKTHLVFAPLVSAFSDYPESDGAVRRRIEQERYDWRGYDRDDYPQPFGSFHPEANRRNKAAKARRRAQKARRKAAARARRITVTHAR